MAKIVNYPLEKRDYKPLAQARLCVNETDFCLRMWAFETAPSPQSRLICNLNFFPERSSRWISLRCGSDGRGQWLVCGPDKISPLAEYFVLPQLKAYVGEDLEGIYWGAVVALPLTALDSVYGAHELPLEHRLTGNLYKVDDAAGTRHYGCFYPVDFTRPDPYDAHSFGEFEIVAY
ncbi:MAG: hypothetical protein PHD67_04460 [Oscillospiraceae bacterium]|nr:hypothetical protein [Oscillospiraceae bacterium]